MQPKPTAETRRPRLPKFLYFIIYSFIAFSLFDFLIALAAGGVQQGLPYATAMELAVQTVIGSARLVAETGEHPAVLRDQVISPGGATAVGCAVLEKNAFRGIVAQAVVEAAKRSEELGKK